MNKGVSRASKSSTPISGGVSAVPLNIIGPIRRFWDFTKKTAHSFSKNTKDPEKRESEFIKAVEKDLKDW